MLARDLIQSASSASFDMLRSLFDNSPSAIVLADTQRNILDVNDSFCRIFQYEKANARQIPVSELYVEISEFERIRDRIKNGSDRIGEKFYASFRRNDGSVFPGQASLTELFDERGRKIGTAGIINDLTDINGEDVDLLFGVERLTAERSRQKTLYMRSPAMMHSINEAGFIETVSDAWLRRFGYTEQEVVGKRSKEFLTPESQRFATETVLPEFWRTGSCERVPYNFVHKDGSIIEIELSAVLDRTLGCPTTLAVLEDVTERNASRRALEQVTQDMRDFAHLAAHDLQTPVRHISVFSGLLREDIEAGATEEVANSLQIIEDSVQSLTGMIPSLLEFSISGKAAIVAAQHDANLMVLDTLKILAADIADSDASVHAARLPALYCDRALMMRVFSNLIGNAIKYVAPGERPQITLSGSVTENETILQIRDNGIGIPRQHREKVFQPLRRLHGADSDYTGTGIGLALCRRIVDAHGGSIQIGDAGPVGTMIEVRLPTKA